MGSETRASLSLVSRSESQEEPQIASKSMRSQANSWTSRSCYGCNRKKIRCDKKEPCSTCARAGKPCLFPPVGPRTRRSKKTIMADMASRISSLEKSLTKAVEDESSVVKAETKKTAQPMHHSVHFSARPKEDVLVQKGSSSQYFNEVLLSRVLKEQRNIKSVLTSPQPVPPYPPVPSPFNASGILSSPLISISPADLHPPQQLAVRLWNIYVDYVENCTGLKLLHLPTHEVKVYSIINDPKTASLDDLALVFAIYFAAIISIDNSEAQLMLGEDKHSTLFRFKVGLEQAFAQGDFLDCPNLTMLHALAIYLSALRVHNRGKGIWILNGLAIRIAQSLGLHRDGKRLGLSPFESEIRRRLWWQFLSRDSRAGEDYGLENTCNFILVSDVNLPLNVDDTDIYPEMKKLPEAKQGWTAMTFSLINIDLAKTIQRIASTAASSLPSSPPSEDVRSKIIKGAEERVEEFLQYCNPVIPQQRQTLVCARFLLKKIDFTTRLQWILLQRSGDNSEFVTEQNLVEALEILEPRLHSGDGLLKQYSWARKAYPQYHVTMYVLWHLCVKPEGPNIDKAWKAVDDVFSEELGDELIGGFGPKSSVLMALKAKAVLVRERIQRRNLGEINGAVDPDSGTVSVIGSTEDEELPAYLFGDTIENGLGLSGDSNDWPNWSTMVQGFQLDNPNSFW